MKDLILRRLRDDTPKAVLLCAIAGGAGLAANLLRAEPLPHAHIPRAERLDAAVAKLQTALAATPAGAATTVEAAEVASVLGDPRVILVDVRPDLFFADGHLPGAINFPRERLAKEYAQLKTALTGSTLVVVYCAGHHCEEAEAMAAALTRLGHGNIAVYRGGWEEWSGQSRPAETGAAREGVR